MNESDRFLAAVKRTIERRGLLKGRERVLLAVSGGADSLALMHVMHRLAPKLKLSLHVAHFDHLWRPDGAHVAAVVRRSAEQLGIPVIEGVADSADRLPGQSREEGARTRRMAFLSDTANALQATRVATGHTLDDQAETVLMRVLVGAGKRGLSGIPPVRWYTIRPLIDVRRAETEAFCHALGLKPVQDPSNLDTTLLRNHVRLNVLPPLRAHINGRLEEQLARMADIERDEDYFLDQQASKLAAPEATDEGSRLAIDTLRALPPALQRRAVRLLARNEGPGIDAEHTDAVLALALEGRTGSQLHLPGPLNARVEYGFLLVGTATSPSHRRETVELTIPGGTELVSWDLHVRSWISEDRPTGWPDGRNECVIDADRATFPLRVRRWHDGDRFRPLGMARRKKVGDFFTDERVPSRKRGEIPLVVDATDEVAWVAGHRIDDRVKVSDRTRRFLWLALEGS